MVGSYRCTLAVFGGIQPSSLRALDTTHSLLVYVSIWIYLITNYGKETTIETISMYVWDVVPFYSMIYESNIV